MATIEQAPPQVDTGSNPEQVALGPLNYLLARAYALNWELIFYSVLFVVAVLTRFVNLGDRVMSHDESLHTNYSFGLYQTGKFEHTPLMHGPLLFHATALMYLLFGDSDFTARLYPAILGVILVLLPRLLFSKWLGKLGSAVASVMLLISPMVLFHNRYIREDTPSIFFTLLMVYAIFAYLDGVKPRQFRWLLLLAGAMLLSLASKEVGFMYLGIFFFFLALFWLLQVVQGLRRGLVKPIIGWLLGVPIGLGLLVGGSFAFGSFVSSTLPQIGINLTGPLVTLVASLIFLIIFGFAALLLFQQLRGLVASLGQYGNSVFHLVIAGIIVGTVAALGATSILSISQGSANANLDEALIAARQTQWFLVLIAPLLLVVIGTALIRFTRSPWMGALLLIVLAGLVLVALVGLPLLIKIVLFIALVAAAVLLIGMLRAFTTALLPWPDILIVLGVSAVTAVALTFVEERSKLPSVSAVIGPPYVDAWLYAPWVVAAVIIGILLVLRFYTPFFEEMRRYPVFDVLILMGTLILPWLAAFPVFQAHYPLGDNSLNAVTLEASFKAIVPFIAVSIAVGLCWNPQLWIPCTAVFYSLFAFFYTTMFTNGAGIGTGLIGSLGYWLSQQGVRRGSQPQYYYLFVELPVYEYLPVIGATVAGIVGLFSLWRFRMARYMDEPLPPETATQPDNYGENVDAAGQVSETMNMDGVSGTVETPIQTMPLELHAEVEALEPLPGEGAGEQDPLEGLPTDSSEPLASRWSHIESYEPEEALVLRPIAEAEKLETVPFLPFVGFWAVLLIMAFTMAGEKMPWLTTHLTIPLIFATAWYLGTLLEKIEVPAFLKQGWALIALTPILGIALANAVGPFLFGNIPLGGLQRDDLLKTFTWFGAILLVVLILAGMYWVWRRIGTTQTLRTVLVGVFVLLGILTARTAWMAAFINYDYATEFLVYAHGAPADKLIMNELQDLSKRTTDGMGIKVAYDSAISWPGTWYFRNYTNARFLGDSPALTDLDQNVAVVVGNSNNPKIEPVLKDKFYQFKYTRLWWPMQEYDHLDFSRIDNLFSGDAIPSNDWSKSWDPGGKLRQGIWDIWWNRNYTAYGDATGKKFDIADWPLHDTMYFYVRKDVAAQVWDFGTGATKVTALPQDPFNTVRCDTCVPDLTFGEGGTAAGQLNHPRDMTVGPDGNLYVADSLNTRIQVFKPDGTVLREFGTASAGDQGGADGTLREPWGVAVADDGTVYVANTWNHRVEVFDKNGNFLRKWGTFAQITGDNAGEPDNFWGPRDIAVDSENHVYVADTGNKRVRVYDSQGKFLYDIGHDPNGIQLNEPVGLAIDNQRHELYIADTWNKRVEVVNLSTPPKEVASFSLQAWNSTTESANRPYLALDKTGAYLFITDPDLSRVLVMDAKTGQALASFTTQGGVLGGIAIDPNGQIYVADTANGQIMRYSLTAISGLGPGMQAPPANLGGSGPATEAATDQNF